MELRTLKIRVEFPVTTVVILIKLCPGQKFAFLNLEISIAISFAKVAEKKVL